MPISCRSALNALFFVICLLAIPCAASAAPAATNIEGIATVEAPPAGFDALHATLADLKRYGLPLRPDALRAPAAYVAWTHIVGSAKHFVTPFLRQKEIRHLPLKRVNKAAVPTANRNLPYVYSNNWSGIADAANFSSFGANSVDVLYGEWVVPIAQQAFGTCNGRTDYSAIWMGIDGYNNNDVFQGGTEADATCSGGYTSPDYYIWFEWYPDYSYEITNLPVAPGDDVAGVLVADSTTSGSFYVINETTGVYTTVALKAPAGTTLAGNSCEWIVELPSVNNVEGTLTNYVADFVTNTVAGQRNGNTIIGGYGNSVFPLYIVTMLDSNNNPISQPLAVGGSGSSFEDEGSAK
jgi:hypothetical protein